MMIALAAISAAYAQSPDVRVLQERLVEQGFNPGPIDGLMGSRTQQALRAFQIHNGLEPTGELNPQTVGALARSAPQPSVFPAQQPAPLPPQQIAPPPPSPAAAPGFSSVPAGTGGGRDVETERSGGIFWWAVGLFVLVYFVLRRKRKAKIPPTMPETAEPDLPPSRPRRQRASAEPISFDSAPRFVAPDDDRLDKIDPYWHPPGQAARVDGLEIGDMVYVGPSPNTRRYSRIANWLIDPTLPIGSGPADVGGDDMAYWPDYASISPNSRLAFMEWLSSGRRDRSYGIGYVFLYFYGLEYRLLCGDPSIAERAALVSEIQRLRGIYGENGSFNRYSKELLDVTAIVAPDGLSEEPNLDTSSWELPIGLKVGLGRRLAAGEPLDGAWMLAWWLNHPSTRRRTSARRAATEFCELFKLRFAKMYPEGYKVNPPKPRLKYTYRAASGRFTRDFEAELAGCPDVSRLTKPVNVARKIAEACMDDLDAFSRYLGRNPEGRGTLEGHALLPTDLAAQLPNAELDELKEWAEAKIDQDQGLVPVEELLARLEGKTPERIARRSLSSAASALAHIAIGFAPDPSFALRMPKSGEPIQLFWLGENVERLEAVSADYTNALLSVTLGALVAHADGVVSDSERHHITAMIDGWGHLTETERNRLRANINWMIAAPPKLASLRKHFSDLEDTQKHAVGQLAIAIAASDGVIDPAEIKTVQKLYKTLDLPESSVFSDIHALGGVTPAQEPVTVRPATPTQNTHRIPPAPEEAPGRSNGIELDRAKIAVTMGETARVSNILGEIFGEDELIEMETEQEADTEGNKFDGLDAAHQALASELVTQPTWTTDDFAQLAAQFDLMAEGARETLNEWAFEKFDEPLIEEDEELEINLAALKASEHHGGGSADVAA